MKENNREKRGNLIVYEEAGSFDKTHEKALKDKYFIGCDPAIDLGKGNSKSGRINVLRNRKGKIEILKPRQMHSMGSYSMMIKKIMKLWKK